MQTVGQGKDRESSNRIFMHKEFSIQLKTIYSACQIVNIFSEFLSVLEFEQRRAGRFISNGLNGLCGLS